MNECKTVGTLNPDRAFNAIANIISSKYECKVKVKQIVKKNKVDEVKKLA